MERMAQIAEPQTFCRLPYAAPYRNTIALGELRVLSRAARRQLVAAHRAPDRAPSNPRPWLFWPEPPDTDQTEQPMTGPRALSPQTVKP
jgi:hypothetical protein